MNKGSIVEQLELQKQELQYSERKTEINIGDNHIFNTDNNIAIQQEEKLSINSTLKKDNGLTFSFSSLSITKQSSSEEQFVKSKNKKKKRPKI